MATYPLPQAQRGMEHTPSDPMQGTADEPQNSAQLNEEDQQRLIALVRRYKDQWSQDRVVLMQRCLQNLEFFKGNQFISFGPGESEFFNAVDWMNQGDHAQDADDKDLYQYCNNFYQMLATGFVAALAPQVPKSKWMPEDAEQLSDVTTAKAAQILIDIIEQQNREQSLLKQQLLYLYTTGAVFRHTRYVVDGERAGTTREPVFNETETQLAPDRYHCFHCGATSPVSGDGWTALPPLLPASGGGLVLPCRVWAGHPESRRGGSTQRNGGAEPLFPARGGLRPGGEYPAADADS